MGEIDLTCNVFEQLPSMVSNFLYLLKLVSFIASSKPITFISAPNSLLPVPLGYKVFMNWFAPRLGVAEIGNI